MPSETPRSPDESGGHETGGYEPETYGDRIAEVYDDWYATLNPAMIDVLAELGGEGPVLELGIGTGRIALPLVERGVEVHGIDASEAMVDKLRAKPKGRDIPVTIGSFHEFSLDARYRLAFVVFNTFYALLTQEEQIACFASVARHLEPGGVFVLETFVPDVARFTRGQNTSTSTLGTDFTMLESSIHDAVNQRVRSLHVCISKEGNSLYPVHIRYAWPSELDLMARLAGLVRRDQWSSWARSPFTASAGSRVVVYEKPT